MYDLLEFSQKRYSVVLLLIKEITVTLHPVSRRVILDNQMRMQFNDYMYCIVICQIQS